MFPHLVAMKESFHLSSEDMADIIGVARQTFEYKLQRGNFTPQECKAFCKYFEKSFDYLFATLEEIDRIDAMIADGGCPTHATGRCACDICIAPLSDTDQGASTQEAG